jgi:hypothetical protein
MPPVAVYEVASFYTMYNLDGRQVQADAVHLPGRAACKAAAADHLREKLGVISTRPRRMGTSRSRKASMLRAMAPVSSSTTRRCTTT